MKDFPSCFGESGTQVAHSSSSSPPTNRTSAASQGHVTCVYYHQSQIFSGFITVTWIKHLKGDGFIVGLDKSSKESLCRVEVKPWLFSRRRGSKNLLADSIHVDIQWDFSSAKFSSGPEPIDGYFLAVGLNQQPCLVLGDHACKIKTIADSPPQPNLIARREHVSGKRLYSSKAQFCNSHQFHDLKWKFRGNQRILVDGANVEVYWDVYSWIFGRNVDHAVFLFRSYPCNFIADNDSSSSAAAGGNADSYGFSFVLCAGIRFLTMVSVFLCVFSTAATAVLSESKPLIAAVLSDLHFQDLATAAVSANFTAIFPITIFAPKQSSLLTCRSCSVVRLLREHTVRGLYSFEILRKLPFGSKIQTLADNRCLSVTTTRAEDQKAAVFINGVEIAEPDLFNNGVLIVHSIQGFVSHLSPLSCRIESMATLSFPENPPSTAALFAMRTMLKETMTALRTSGYSIMALSMRVKYPEISELRSMTLFAVDDETIFTYGGGVRRHNYAAELGFHIVPNKLLYADDLLALPRGTLLPTMQRGRYLEITTAGGGGPLSRMRINYVKVKQLGIVHNNRVAVHSLMMPI